MKNRRYTMRPSGRVLRGGAGVLAAGIIALVAGSTNLRAQGDFWMPLSIGATDIAAITIDSSGDYLAASAPTTGTGRILVSRDKGVTWTPAGGDVGSNVHALATASNGHIFAGSSADGVFRSTDRGATWQPLGPPKTYITALAAAPDGAVYAATAESLYRSTDDGGTWTQSVTGLEGPPEAIAVGAGGMIFVGTYEKGIYRSSDGITWERLGLAHPTFSTVSVADIAIDPANRIYAALQEGGIFRSSDNGTSWTMIPEAFPEADVLTLTVTRNGDLFAGTFRRGVWYTSNGGERWDSTGLDQSPIGSLAYDPAGFVLAGTVADLYRHTDRPAGVDEGEEAIRALALTIGPNPISQTGTISFRLPRRSDVTITLTDTRGRVVATLLDRELDAGEHLVRADAGAGLPPGVYFCTVEAGALRASAPMVVVR